MSIEQIGVELPSDLTLRKKLTDGIDEIVSSMTRTASERDLVKDILKTLKEETGVKPSVIRRFAKWKFKDNKTQEVVQLTEEEAAFNVLYKIKEDDDEADFN